MESPLLSKSKQFALDIIKVCNKVKSEKIESVLTNQLIRSGTSIGANIREAFYGHGKNDFYLLPFHSLLFLKVLPIFYLKNDE